MGLLAAGLVGIGVIAGGFAIDRDGRTADQPSAGVAPQLPVSDTVVRFVLVAPQAETVSLVGDFNGWDATRTPMTQAPSNGVWTVTLPLSVGRHVYSFLVDGKLSVDPNAPLAPDDGFGHANSVKIVRKGAAL
jgi:1,4-alpha-glucan branching enzyme